MVYLVIFYLLIIFFISYNFYLMIKFFGCGISVLVVKLLGLFNSVSGLIYGACGFAWL